MKRLITPLIVFALLLIGSVAVYAVCPYTPPPALTGKTDIYLQNVGTNPADVVLAYTGAGGSGLYTVSTPIPILYGKMIPSNVTGTLSGLPSGWAGAVEVSSSDQLAAVVAMLWDSAGIVTPTKYAAGIYKGFDAPTSTQYLPFLGSSCGVTPTMSSVVTVQNTEADAADVTVEWFNADGSPAGSTGPTSIAGKSEQQFTPPVFAGAGWGAAKVTAALDKKIAAVAELHWGVPNYSGDAYSAVPDGATTLYFPGVFRYPPRYSDIYIQNVGASPAHVDVLFRSKSGALKPTVSLTSTVVIQPSGVYTLSTRYDAPLKKLGIYWAGTVEVIPTPGYDAQKLVGLCKHYQTSGVKEFAFNGAITPAEASSVYTTTGGLNLKIRGLAFPFAVRNRGTSLSKAYSVATIRNLSSKPGYVKAYVYYYSPTGVAKKSLAHRYAIPARGQIDISIAGWLELGTMNAGFMQVKPDSINIQIIGLNRVFWDHAKVMRAAGYTGFVIPDLP